MNPLTQIKNTQKATAAELRLGLSDTASWHDKFRHSAYIFVGGINFELTEGDLLAVFAQYGEIVDVHLVRDKKTGKSRGFAFMAYEDQRSTILAVDNLSGSTVAGRIVRVEHVDNYKKKRAEIEGIKEEDIPDGVGERPRQQEAPRQQTDAGRSSMPAEPGVGPSVNAGPIAGGVGFMSALMAEGARLRQAERAEVKSGDKDKPHKEKKQKKEKKEKKGKKEKKEKKEKKRKLQERSGSDNSSSSGSSEDEEPRKAPAAPTWGPPPPPVRRLGGDQGPGDRKPPGAPRPGGDTGSRTHQDSRGRDRDGGDKERERERGAPGGRDADRDRGTDRERERGTDRDRDVGGYMGRGDRNRDRDGGRDRVWDERRESDIDRDRGERSRHEDRRDERHW